MLLQPLKRAKSDGTEPKDVTTAEARARMDRAFTMPQFVTSVAGYGGSARSKQVRAVVMVGVRWPIVFVGVVFQKNRPTANIVPIVSKRGGEIPVLQ